MFHSLAWLLDIVPTPRPKLLPLYNRSLRWNNERKTSPSRWFSSPPWAGVCEPRRWNGRRRACMLQWWNTEGAINRKSSVKGLPIMHCGVSSLFSTDNICALLSPAMNLLSCNQTFSRVLLAWTVGKIPVPPSGQTLGLGRSRNINTSPEIWIRGDRPTSNELKSNMAGDMMPEGQLGICWHACALQSWIMWEILKLPLRSNMGVAWWGNRRRLESSL